MRFLSTAIAACVVAVTLVFSGAQLDPTYVAVSFAVGILLGLTGAGGGALYTPILVLLGVRRFWP